MGPGFQRGTEHGTVLGMLGTITLGRLGSCTGKACFGCSTSRGIWVTCFGPFWQKSVHLGV